MKLRPISLILPFVLFAVSSSLGQLIGSSENGQSTPKEVKSSEITSGGISADVNLFTGTLNASYSLGTVNTPTGLSFEVTSSYNSTFATGDNLPHLSGIPYGEGWEINLPTISVSVDDYNKYTLEEKNWIIRSFGQRHETFVGNEVDNEGKLFWFSPMLSIPGVASGRMVYKYSRNGKHYFVLRKFERYIEATFSGQYWEVVIDDGTRYEFGPMGVSHRNAINQRIHPTQPSYPYYDDYDVKHLMLPQTEYLTWHCMNIRNSDLIGNIDFTYYAYGAMDFYSAYKQPALDFCLGSEWGENSTLKTVYRDIFIKEINSGYERMQFTYTSIPLSGSADLLDVNAPDVEPVDDLYNKKTIYETDGNSLLAGWRRYKHVKSDGLSSSTFNLAVPTNPYLAVSNTIPSSGGCNNAEGLYITEPLGSQDNSFSHGFLESPRLVPTGDNVVNPPGWNSQQVSMPPGEVYEISARIQKGGIRECLFDVNLATGDYSSGLVTPAGHPDYPINCSYMTTRGQTVFSTFNQGIKWHSKGNYPEDLVDISNYFVMPNLPRAFRGFNIQIGPANSDNNFALNPDEIEYQNDVTRPDICKSYINTPYLGQIALTDPDLGTGDEIAPELLYYTGSTPSNFGIGLPWHIMLRFYRCVSPAMDWCFNTTGSGSSPFWWNDQQTYGTAHPWDNEPTLADQDTRLNNVKIVRYGKNPLMLSHVKKQLLNPGESLPENNDPNAIWHTVLNYKLEYEIETTPHYVNYYNTATQSQQFEPSGYQRNMVKLMRIRQLPNDAGDGSGISDFATIPTTHFEYSTKVSTAQTYEPPEPFFLLGPNSVVPVYNINANYILLTKITDPLGKETVIEYKPYDAGSYKSFKYLRQSSPKDWQHTYPYFGQIRTAQNVAFQVYMTVHSKTVTERRGNKVWTYAFNNLRTLDTEIPINDNFRWDKNYSLEFGYETAVVSGTNGPDGSPVSTYSHHTDRLLWGKLSGVEVRDGSGSLVSSNSYSYEAVLAFEPPFIRTAKSVDDTDDNQDYGEYIHLSGRPLPENYSNPIDYITAILAFIEGLNEEYQTAISALTAPGSAPAGQCPTGNGTVACGCADYEFMDAASKAACDAYWSSWQTYLNQLAQISQEYNQFFSSGDEIPNMSTQTGVYAVPKFYEAIFFRYIINEDPLFLNSYFIKKTAETSTVYDNKCDSQASEQVQTITTYEYFDADYKGTKLSGGFAKMGIEDQVIGGQSYNRLYWEPSWQLYKTTTTSPQLPGFENTEEYFYLYDLINHPYYIRPDDKKTKSTYQMLTLLFTVKKKRDFIFEKRTTRKVYNQQPIVQSEYYIYDKNWEAQLPPQEIVEVDNPYEETGPCVDNSYGNNGGNPFVILPCVLATQGQNLEGYCSYTENIYCPCEIVDDMEPTGGNIIGDDDIMGYVSNSIEGKYFLRQIYVQVRDNTPPVLRFEDDLNNPEFQTDVLSTYYVHSRNGLGQVLLEEDEKQLKTKYDYGITKILVYETCINGILREQYQVLNPNFRAPKSVTIGESLPNSLTTHFTYHPDYTIQSVTDPNGMVLTYDYDGYQRMIKAYRNGVAIQEAAYYNWQNDFGLNFKQRALQNHVDILNLLEDDKGFGTKNFLDPIGRKSGSVSHSTHDGNVVVEDHFFDLYDRPFSSHQPTLGSAPHIALDSENDELSCNHNNMDYDVAPRSNVLQAAKFGLCLNGGHSVNSSYCIATYAQLKNELDHTGQPNVDDILVPGSSYFRTETADEDNKTIIEYTNAIGQKIASITGNGNAATIFTYDAHGRASLVVNAEKQQMTYNCNYLGQVHKKYTPDAGITQIAYNQSGQVILEVDSDGKYTAYAYDAFGRMIKQVDAPSDNGLLADNGSPWITDPSLHALVTLVNTSPKEKEWFYELIDPTSMPRIHTSVMPYLSALNDTRGRIVQTVSYDEGGVPVEYKFFSYDNDGFVDWEIVQFKDLGLSSSGGMAAKLDYNNYNRQGSYGILDVDISLDNVPDFIYFYEYDSRNRIKEVKFTCPETDMYNFHFAGYSYHPVYLTVEEKRYHDQENSGASGICKKQEVDVIFYTYDIRQRLTNIIGKLFTYHLAYDSEVISGGTANYNGNINGTIASYTLSPAGAVPGIFQGSTLYGYRYDEFNRLLSAEANVLYQLENMSTYSGNPLDLGDALYEYDKIGNIRHLTRGIINYETRSIGPATYAYGYSPGNNRLTELRTGGNAPELFQGDSRNYAYLYWNDGSLKSDGKRQIQDISYMRANLVSGFGGSRAYLYDINDQRTYKTANGKEYYLRSSAGQELAILNLSSDEITWYIYGNERIGKLGPNRCELQYCRPDAPACTHTMAAQQQSQLANMTFITSPASLEYPSRLVRVQFCDNTERYLLLDELKQLGGNYHILQQIPITNSQQVFTVQTNGEPYQALLAAVLNLRLGGGPLRLDAYHACETLCDASVFTCPESMRENQEQSVATLRSVLLSSNPASWPLPTQLFRIRLCGGREVYVPGNYLDDLEGAFTIIQTIPISGVDADFDIELPNGNTLKVSLSNLKSYLADLDNDYRINGYEPCYGLLTCDPSLPECSVENSLASIAMLELRIGQTLNAAAVSFPQRLYRIRLCNGREIYALQSELGELEAPYNLLQEINLTSPQQMLQLELTDGAVGDYQVDQMLGFRAQNKLESINGYTSCAPPSSCDTPDCSASEASAQAASMLAIKSQWPSLSAAGVSFPTNIYRIRLCDGTEEYLLEQERSALTGNITIQQQVSVPDATAPVDIIYTDGTFRQGNMADFLSARAAASLYTLQDYIPCQQSLSAICEDIMTLCTGAQELAQNQALQQIRAMWPVDPFSVALPVQLTRVRLCSGQEIYLLPGELAQLPGPIQIIQQVPLNNLNDRLATYYNGQQQETMVTDALRLRGQYTDFAILGYGCTLGSSGICTYAIEQTGRSAEGVVNTRSVRHSYTKLVTRDCGSGTVVVAQENLENIIPAEKNIRIEFGGMQDKTAHLDELILGTRNPGGTLSVDLAPATVLQSYPGLSGTLNTAHLIFNYAAPQQMATAVRQVIEYAIEQWRIQHNAPSVLYVLQVSVNAPTPGSGKISIVFGVYHQPTQAYVCLQPTVSTLSGYQDQGVYTTTAASVDGQGSVQLLAEAAYVVQACNATIRRDYQVTIGYGSNQVTPEGWYTIESGVLSAVPLGGQTSSAQCQETPVVINCETEGEVCAGAACVPCLPAEPVAPLCSGAELAALPQELAELDQIMTQTGVNDLLFPVVLYRLRFCDGSRRYVFDRELGGIDAGYVMEQRLVVRSAADLFRLTYNNGASGQIGAVDVILSQRPGNNGLLITPLPPLQQSSAPGDPLSGDNPGNEGAGRPQVSYYNYDHLGNTRVVYHSVINCAADSIHYMLEYAADYYPFGAILREWENCEKSRFLFTYKERDAETGWDNLGARLYDSDVCRFLGVDPLGEERAWVSSYNYAQNNPIMRIDTDGELDSPIFDKNGNFLGVDSEGYTGEIIIMDRTAFKTVIRKKGNQPLNHDQVMIWAEKSPLVAKLNDGGLSAEGFSKVYTHVVEQMEGELVDGQSFSLDKLEGGIINIIDTVNDHEGLSQLNGERYGNPTNIPISAEAGTKTKKDGSINVTTRILFGKGQMTTVEHAQSTLGVHEYYGHGVRGLAGGDSAEHRKVYRLEFKHKRTFNALTSAQKKSITDNM